MPQRVRPMTRYAEIRSSQLSVSERHPNLGKKVTDLAKISDQQYECAKRIMAGGHLYALDLLLLSLLARSLDIIDAFLASLDRWNVAVASSLVRLQIDNVLRANLFAITRHSNDILLHLIKDRPLRKLPLPSDLLQHIPHHFGKKPKCSDAVLIELARYQYKWLPDAYSTASSWVHHSAAHVLTTWRLAGESRIAGRIPVDIDQFEPDFLEPLLDAMGLASRTLTNYLTTWAVRKEKGEKQQNE